MVVSPGWQKKNTPGEAKDLGPEKIGLAALEFQFDPSSSRHEAEIQHLFGSQSFLRFARFSRGGQGYKTTKEIRARIHSFPFDSCISFLFCFPLAFLRRLERSGSEGMAGPNEFPRPLVASEKLSLSASGM